MFLVSESVWCVISIKEYFFGLLLEVLISSVFKAGTFSSTC